jgi:hypothetical protein
MCHLNPDLADPIHARKIRPTSNAHPGPWNMAALPIRKAVRIQPPSGIVCNNIAPRIIGPKSKYFY